MGAVGLCVLACQARPTVAECEAMLDRYVELLLVSQGSQIPAGRLLERKREARERARDSEAFALCPTKVSERALRCALQAADADAMERCLL
jgi:hypothetical protein